MFEQILQRMQEKIRQQQYVMTLHAEDEMENDNLSIYDIEHGVLSGMIQERQSDRSTSEWKYRIRGMTQDNTELEVVAKLSLNGNLVIITVYLL